MASKLELAGQKTLLIEFAASTLLLIIKVIRDPRFVNYTPFTGTNSITKDQWALLDIKHQLYTLKPEHRLYSEISLSIRDLHKKYMNLIADLEKDVKKKQ